MGRLAGWLRAIGYDTVIYKGDIDRNFLKAAYSDGRVAITRKQDMSRRNFLGGKVVLKSERIREQIHELAGKIPLEPDREKMFTICLRCNAPLEKISHEQAKGLIPDYVFRTHVAFTRCPECRRIYWPGTHLDRALEFIRTHIQKDRP